MAQAAAHFTTSLVAAMNGADVSECCFVQTGEDTDSFHAQPVKQGKNGVESIPAIPALSAYEQKLFTELKSVLDGNIAKVIEFAKA
jgi:malate/lactate dehydrogenase